MKILSLILFILYCNITFAQKKSLDRIVAVVDNEIIVESELNAQVEFFVFNNRIDSVTPDLKKRVLDGMITDKLILAKAIEDSVTVSDDEVQQQLDDVVRQRVLQAGSEKKLEEMYGMSIAKIKIEFRDEMRKQLLTQRMQQTKFGRGNVSRREVEQFFQLYKDSLPNIPAEAELAHIFVKPKASSDVKGIAKAKAQHILDSLKSGADFSSLAKTFSDDVGSAADGGDLGFVRRGQFVKEFEEAVFALKDSEFAPVVETEFGFHVVQLLERRGEAVHPRHILIRVGKSEKDDDAAIQFLNSLNDSLVKGKTFAELAKKYSDDKETALIGGTLGTLPLAQLDADTKVTVDTMHIGALSSPMKTLVGSTLGYHIVLLKNKTKEHTANLAEDYKRIEQLALQYKRSNEYRTWIEELKKNIYWESRL